MVEMDTLEDLKGLIEYDICLYDKKLFVKIHNTLNGPDQVDRYM